MQITYLIYKCVCARVCVCVCVCAVYYYYVYSYCYCYNTLVTSVHEAKRGKIKLIHWGRVILGPVVDEYAKGTVLQRKHYTKNCDSCEVTIVTTALLLQLRFCNTLFNSYADVLRDPVSYKRSASYTRCYLAVPGQVPKLKLRTGLPRYSQKRLNQCLLVFRSCFC